MKKLNKNFLIGFLIAALAVFVLGLSLGPETRLGLKYSAQKLFAWDSQIQMKRINAMRVARPAHNAAGDVAPQAYATFAIAVADNRRQLWEGGYLSDRSEFSVQQTHLWDLQRYDQKVALIQTSVLIQPAFTWDNTRVNNNEIALTDLYQRAHQLRGYEYRYQSRLWGY